MLMHIGLMLTTRAERGGYVRYVEMGVRAASYTTLDYTVLAKSSTCDRDRERLLG